jgi:hypothetical protein
VAPAVLGDFLAAADGHIGAAALAASDLATGVAPAAQDLYRLVAVLSRYCGDLAPYDEVEASGRDDLHAWEHAVTDAGAALVIAGDYLRRGAEQAATEQPGDAPGQARHLAAAATGLMAGRDLLRTHHATDPAGMTQGRSEWAPVVTSLPVLRAMGNEVGRWSRQLALYAALLARSPAWHGQPGGQSRNAPVTARSAFASASQWLGTAGTAARMAMDIDPVRTSDTELLYAIPAATVPSPRRPRPVAESVADLCDGITVSASRLRGAMCESEQRARWSPGVTSGGWQWVAQAAAVTCHLSELALGSLATRAGELASVPVSGSQLDAAAGTLTGMRAAWQHVDLLWDGMITERRLLANPAMTDASDLVLRLGRLVWDNPHWTPGSAHRAPRRPPPVLAPGAADFRAVTAAVHQAIDALALVAKADGHAVESAAAAGRLYVPTWSLPEDYDVPRPFAPAPATRCQVLHEAYGAALGATITAARALDELALTAGTPSRFLALARAAAQAQVRQHDSQDQPDDGISPVRLPAGMPWESRTSTGRPGAVELAIRGCGVSDPITLLRAAAIDNAASRLITQAENATGVPDISDTPKSQQHTVGNAAQLAAQSFPRDQAVRPPEQQPSRSAGQRSRLPGIRVTGRAR